MQNGRTRFGRGGKALHQTPVFGRTALILGVAIIATLVFLSWSPVAMAGLGLPGASQETTEDAASDVPAGDPWTLDSDCATCHPNEADAVAASQEEAPAAASEADGANDGASTEGTDETGGDEAPARAGLTKIGASQSADTGTGASTSATNGSSDDALLAAVHDTQYGATCFFCHDTEAMESVHEGMTVDEAHAPTRKLTRLYSSSVSNEVCLTCHDQEALIEATAASDVLTDDNGLVVNPHDFPATETHVNNISCVSCHKMHNAKTGADRAFNVCAKCHHEYVWACGTCHVV